MAVHYAHPLHTEARMPAPRKNPSEMKRINLNLPAQLVEQLYARAAANHRSATAELIVILERELAAKPH